LNGNEGQRYGLGSKQETESGVIVVDKPVGMTSARVVAAVKKLFDAKKTGHAGTLDPLASGLLVCCINKATRLSGFFMKGRKTYEAVCRLGTTTDTQDAEGAVLKVKAVAGIDDKSLLKAFGRFTGTIDQTPPVYSALKHQGVPLYKLARAGKPVEKPPRQVHIFALELLNIAIPDVRFRVTCSAGTYVRTLCADIGAVLECGGHLTELRRLESGGFTLSDAWTLSELKAEAKAGSLKNRLIGMADALKGMPTVVADESLSEKVCHGRPLNPLDLVSSPAVESGEFKIVDSDNRLLAVVSRDGSSETIPYCCVFSA
jgi:tRNA pseudouridine55 synthase